MFLYSTTPKMKASLPLRERGLKQEKSRFLAKRRMSLPLRERGLKLNTYIFILDWLLRRSPCGSVD